MKIYVCKGHVGNKERLSRVYCIQLNLFVFIYRDLREEIYEIYEMTFTKN